MKDTVAIFVRQVQAAKTVEETVERLRGLEENYSYLRQKMAGEHQLCPWLSHPPAR